MLPSYYRAYARLCSPFGAENSREVKDVVIFSTWEKRDEVFKPSVTIGLN